MKRIIITSLIGITTLTTIPLILPLLPQRSYAQTSNSQVEKLEQLIKTAQQQKDQYQYQESIETLQQALAIARKIKYREKEGVANLGLGISHYLMGKRQEALNFYDQALMIFREVGDRLGETATLNNIGLAYHSIGKPQKALEYYEQALPISQEVEIDLFFHKSGKVKALEYYEQALPIRQEVATPYDVASIFYSISFGITRPLKVLEYCEQALPTMQEVGDQPDFATTLNNIGGVYHSIGKPLKALIYYGQALPIWQEVGNRSGEGDTLNNIGVVCYSVGQFGKALEYFEQALPITQEVGDRSGEATTLNNIGYVYRRIGKPQKALEYFEQALPMRQEVADRLGEAITLNNIGGVYNDIGKPQKALEYFEQALPITQEVGDPSGEATTLNNIGLAYHSTGKPQKALEYLEQALPIAQEVGDRSGEATTLNNIGLAYHNIGKPQKALAYFKLALSITEKVGTRSSVAATLNNIGGVYNDIGKPQKALEYFERALRILEVVGILLSSSVAATLNNIGGVYNDIGQPQKALEYFERALPIWQKVSDPSGEAATLNNIGGVYYSIGQLQKALEYLEQALPIWQKVSYRSGETTTLHNMGRVYRDNNQLEKAINHWEKSIQTTLEMRAGLKKENRKAFLEDNDYRAITLIDLLIDQNQDDAAWKWHNLATTFDLADYTRLIDAKVKNPEAQKLINQWQQKNQLLQILYGKIKDEWSPQLSQQLNQLQAETNQLADNITNKYPEVAELFEFKPEDIDKLKANIAPDTVVIQPALLKGIPNVPDSIAIFLVTRDKPTIVKKVPIDTKEFDRLLTEYRAQLENPNADDYDLNQEKLYDYLIRPMETEITAYSPKQLAIIATGKLRYIPFETLYDKETNQYLIAKYPIHNLTRISATRKQQQKTTNSPTVLAFGNPTPTKIDLPGAEIEAKSIVEKLSGKHLIREKATLASFKTESSGFSLVHLATHGCFQKEGCPGVGLEENTILFANGKTFNIADAALLGLENTDLIVLSACQTAMKADSNGEEIAGVAYLFERAGADAVIASLWNAEDGITKDIMVNFYENVKAGMTKVEALRQAKLGYVRENIHPFYWSPLILIGEGE
ncbi:MAG: CHAT domain-containing protein [Okeania sp. SIO3H1]|nr:CHAT domain-containing protein [Okeania sp. SIO3H1]